MVYVYMQQHRVTYSTRYRELKKLYIFSRELHDIISHERIFWIPPP